MSAAYTLLPTTAQYPPNRTQELLSRLSAARPSRIRRILVLAAVLGLSSTLLVCLVFYSSRSVPQRSSGSVYSERYDDEVGGDSTSPFFRDAHPALHARLFLARAQADIRARALDTCNGKLGGAMVDAYLAAAVPYCAGANSSVTCFPARAGPGTPNDWWPYPQAFCASQNLAHTHGWGGDIRQRGRFTGRCTVSAAGARLKAQMGREVFLGTEFDESAGEQVCAETVAHPVLFVPRQDRWNPFHVGEDLVTTFLALTLFSRHIAPPAAAALWTQLPAAMDAASGASLAVLTPQLEAALADAAGLQLVFQDAFRPTDMLFAPLYDRIGAYTPRRTAAEALGAAGGQTCFTTAFHSVGAGASLLSATKVGRQFTCASELVWGTALWLRWVWGLEALPGAGAALHGREGGEGESEVARRPWGVHARAVQVLFLSREKFDAYSRHLHDKLQPWQEARHIQNEAALVAGLHAGLAGLCRVVTLGGTSLLFSCLWGQGRRIRSLLRYVTSCPAD
ncbi:hypothetical protein B0H15DRAFT_850032 [Mycena belliarum]|uniref:Uncharacterized protein n=1 Tax=Mycena belliarum TaxID=1033014 RepID=A0AAD6XP86_9AGAR|nr:hypothetical protein B0H15DRAFT_850032 [Mycena belliae]